MAEHMSLRAFQEYLNQRLKVQATDTEAPLLAIQTGNANWLLEPSDSDGIATVDSIVPVPMTRPSFLGITNIQGALYGVNDIAQLNSNLPTERTPKAKLIILNNRYKFNTTLLVEGSIQLRKRSEFSHPSKLENAPPWCTKAYHDPEGLTWQMISVHNLLADRDFNKVGL